MAADKNNLPFFGCQTSLMRRYLMGRLVFPGLMSLNSDQNLQFQTHWHAKPECFHCNVCRAPLLGKKMAKKFGLVLCSSDCARKAAAMNPNLPSSPKPSVLTTDFWAKVNTSSLGGFNFELVFSCPLFYTWLIFEMFYKILWIKTISKMTESMF